MKRVARLGLMLLSVLLPLLFEKPVPAAALAASEVDQQEACLVLGGRETLDPLRIFVWPDGNMAVYRWRRMYPGSSTEAYMNCYFEQNAWGSMLDLRADTDRFHWSTEYFQDVQYPDAAGNFLLPAGEQTLSEDTIHTEWLLLDGELLLRQSLSYQDGDDLLIKRYDLINRGNRTFTQVRLTHGGDIFFGEEASCAWDEAHKTMIIGNLEQHVGGRAEFSCAPQYPIAGWFAGSVHDAWDLLRADSPLTGLGAEQTDDAACLMQGTKDSLEPGEQWSLVLYERYPDTSEPVPTVPAASVTTSAGQPETTRPEFSETTRATSSGKHETIPAETSSAPASTADGGVPATGSSAEAAMAGTGGALLLLAVIAAAWRGRQVAAGFDSRRRPHE